MGTQKTRIDKVEWLEAMLRKFFSLDPGGSIDKEKLGAEFMMKFGSAKRTYEELILMLERTSFIKVRNKEIFKGSRIK
jgi:hypothetical protein